MPAKSPEGSTRSSVERRLVDLAVERGYLTRGQVDKCLGARASADASAPLDVIAVSMGYLTNEDAEELVRDARESAPPSPPAEPKPEPEAEVEEVKIYGASTVVEPIGRGPSGTVYKAFHGGLLREVALKVIRVNPLNKPFLGLFKERAGRVQDLEHPNIARVHEVGEQPDAVYVSSELVDGVGLLDFVKGIGVLAPAQAISVLRQVALALEAAHEAGAMHGNVKPENVLLVGDGAIKVTDFGLARDETKFVKDHADLTGSLVHSMAPEQWNGDTVPASDLYACGALWYLMLTGKVVFETRCYIDLRKKHESALPKAPTKVRSDLPPEVDLIAATLLQKDPEKRYAGPRALLSDLDRMERGQAVRGRSMGATVRRGMK